MSRSASIPSHLVPFLASPQTPFDAAVDALEEWILYRRTKGDTLFEMSIGLAELENNTPPHVSAAFDRARSVTNVPPPSDLTPPMGPFPLASSATTVTIVHHLLSQPPPSIERSREVILEFLYAREQKLREKKPGRGGKGTMGREAFDEISRKLSEVEDGLKVTSTDNARDTSYPTPTSPGPSRLSESRTIGLTLVLALRMSLSYFTLNELGNQLRLLAVPDAERTLVQHIRRRVQGEGRWGVGKELEYLESLTLRKRPALRPAFRSAKNRMTLASQPLFPIPLPAPSKSQTIKLLTSFAKDVDSGNILSIMASAQLGGSLDSPTADRGHFLSRRTPASPTGTTPMSASSPRTPLSALPPPTQSPTLPPNMTRSELLAAYALELVSEFLTREKREYMIKQKWAKSGRESLGKDLGDIESSLCLANKSTPSPHASALLPVFLGLRRAYALPKSPISPSVIEPYLDLLPIPPDPDDVPFREPTVQTTTAALYVNPRLDDVSAYEVLEELIANEQEKMEAEGALPDEAKNWLTELISGVEKRFPDGSYASVFAQVREEIENPRLMFQQPPPLPPPQSVRTGPTPPAHRRALSNATQLSGSPTPASPAARLTHTRSISMPMRQQPRLQDNDNNDDRDSNSTFSTEAEEDSIHDLPPKVPAIQTQMKKSASGTITLLPAGMPIHDLDTSFINSAGGLSATSVSNDSSSGWWDIVSAVQPSARAPWEDNTSPRRNRVSGGGSPHLPLPPGAEPAQPEEMMFERVAGIQLDPYAYSHSPSRSTSHQQEGTGLSSPSRQQTMQPRAPAMDMGESNGSPRRAAPQTSSRTAHNAESQNRSPIPINFARPIAQSSPSAPAQSPGPAGGSTSGPGTPVQGETASPPVKTSRLFGRSLTLSSRPKNKDKDKENDRASGVPVAKAGKAKVKNDPGRWNRDMVADIMGPPADRR